MKKNTEQVKVTNPNPILGISFNLAQSIVNYLVTKPYGETFQLIQALQALQEVKPEVEKPSDDK